MDEFGKELISIYCIVYPIIIGVIFSVFGYLVFKKKGFSVRRIIFLFFILVSFLFSAEVLGKNYKEISKLVQEVCPIKNVDIDKHKDWAGYVELKDGSIVALSSSKYTFAYMLIVQKREGQDSVKNIYVTDYKSKKLIDAKTAYYVFGSNIMSVGG